MFSKVLFVGFYLLYVFMVFQSYPQILVQRPKHKKSNMKEPKLCKNCNSKRIKCIRREVNTEI
jgi:hypothetical protein